MALQTPRERVRTHQNTAVSQDRLRPRHPTTMSVTARMPRHRPLRRQELTSGLTELSSLPTTCASWERCAGSLRNRRRWHGRHSRQVSCIDCVDETSEDTTLKGTFLAFASLSRSSSARLRLFDSRFFGETFEYSCVVSSASPRYARVGTRAAS